METRLPDRGRALTAVVAVGLTIVVLAVASMVLRERSFEVFYNRWMLHSTPHAIVLLLMGSLVLRRRPGHGAGRVLLVLGALASVHAGLWAVIDARLAAAGIDDAHATFVPAELPLDAAIPLWVISWFWVPAAVLLVTMLLLVFPDGELPGGRWRWVPGVTGVGTGLLMAAHAVVTWPTSTTVMTTTDIPLDGGGLPTLLAIAGGAAVVVASAASVTVLVGRWRCAESEARRLFRAVGTAAIVLAAAVILTWPWPPVWRLSFLLGMVGLFVTYGLAVARYRLHDLDPVLSRAAVGAILAAGVTGVYLLIVVGIGSLIGRRGESTLLPLLAVGVVAVLIEPARRNARALVDRVLYGRDTDRAAVLARLAERAGSATSSDDVLTDAVDLLVRSTGATRAEIWLEVDARMSLAASFGPAGEAEPCLRAPIVHLGEQLGDVRLHARHPSDLVDDASELVADVTHSLGVFLRNVRLTADLQAQLEELRRSRQRLVEVHDEARRSLERDIHDGAQARLIGLRLRLGAIQTLAEGTHPGALSEQLTIVGQELDAAVQSLRDLARGLHPALLEQSGVGAALRATARGLPLTVTVEDESVGRYVEPVEAAVYFSCLEALQNAVRHAKASQVTVRLLDDAGALRFSVEDDGVGFHATHQHVGSGLDNVHDRLASVGGSMELRTSPGEGTTVTGEIPVQASDSAR